MRVKVITLLFVLESYNQYDKLLHYDTIK